MSSLVKYQPKKDLTKFNRVEIIELLQKELKGKVLAAYLFGSVAEGKHHSGSDIDLIIISENPDPNFTKRGMEFGYLHDIHPALDLLVYTPSEFENQLKESLGFWGSVQKSMIKIV